MALFSNFFSENSMNKEIGGVQVCYSKTLSDIAVHAVKNSFYFHFGVLYGKCTMNETQYINSQ